MDLVREVVLVVATIGQLTFVLLYSALPWYASRTGRVLYFNAVVLLSLLALGTLGRIGGQPASDTTFTALYSALALGVWWQVRTFTTVLFHKESDPDGER